MVNDEKYDPFWLEIDQVKSKNEELKREIKKLQRDKYELNRQNTKRSKDYEQLAKDYEEVIKENDDLRRRCTAFSKDNIDLKKLVENKEKIILENQKLIKFQNENFEALKKASEDRKNKRRLFYRAKVKLVECAKSIKTHIFSLKKMSLLIGIMVGIVNILNILASHLGQFHQMYRGILHFFGF